MRPTYGRKASENMDAVKLKLVLELHAKWLNGEKDGTRVNLANADLRNA
jgi:hypothetical protein